MDAVDQGTIVSIIGAGGIGLFGFFAGLLVSYLIRKSDERHDAWDAVHQARRSRA